MSACCPDVATVGCGMNGVLNNEKNRWEKPKNKKNNCNRTLRRASKSKLQYYTADREYNASTVHTHVRTASYAERQPTAVAMFGAHVTGWRPMRRGRGRRVNARDARAPPPRKIDSAVNKEIKKQLRQSERYCIYHVRARNISLIIK